MPKNYDEATKSKAVRLVVEHRDEYDSEYACIRAVAARIGVGPETLRKWVRQAEIEAGERDGVTTATARETRELRRKVSELEQTIEILKDAWRGRALSQRALWDMTLTEILAGYYEPDQDGRRKPESLYGATKMWAHLQRQGIEVARCTVERLMRANGWHGVTRRKKVRTTVADPDAARPPDLVDRQFSRARPVGA